MGVALSEGERVASSLMNTLPLILCRTSMIQQIVADKERLDTDHIIITHSLAFESCDYIKAKLEAEFPGVDIICTVAGCVISSHCGKGTIGILYMVKE